MRGSGNNFLDNSSMNKLSGIKHIFFDLDHTLWDFDKNSALAFESIFVKNKIDISVDEFLEVYIPINTQYWKMYRESRVTKEQLRYGRLSKAFKSLQREIDDHLINRLSDDYIDHLPHHNHLFDNTVEVLEGLSKNYVLHIITNGFEEVQTLKLKNSGIEKYFATVTTSESVGVKKPNPKIFKAAMRSAGALYSESLMIGDTYEADIVGALAVGMRAICFNYHKDKLADEILVIDKLIELQRYI